MPLLERSRARADEVQPGLADELDRALAGIVGAWPRDLPVGHIHADLFPDNVFFLDGRLSGLIDFYFAATDILAYDLAVCLNAWCFEPDFSFNVTKARAMLAAYGAIRPLSDAERAALPVLCQGAAIRFLLTRLYDWLNTPPGALVTRKDPLEFLRRLRFHLAARSEHAYGIPFFRGRHTHTWSAVHGRCGDLDRWRLQAQSGAGRLGRHFAFPWCRTRTIGSRTGYHQQPHGTDRRNASANDIEAPVSRRAAHRQRIRAERRHSVARRLGAPQLAQCRGRSFIGWPEWPRTQRHSI